MRGTSVELARRGSCYPRSESLDLEHLAVSDRLESGHPPALGDTAIITSAQTTINAEIEAVQAAVTGQYVAVIVQRSATELSPTYTVVTVW